MTTICLSVGWWTYMPITYMPILSMTFEDCKSFYKSNLLILFNSFFIVIYRQNDMYKILI
jgi:hypothetical protein